MSLLAVLGHVVLRVGVAAVVLSAVVSLTVLLATAGLGVAVAMAVACLIVVAAALGLAVAFHDAPGFRVTALVAAQPVLPLLFDAAGGDGDIAMLTAVLFTVLLDMAAPLIVEGAAAEAAALLTRLGAALAAMYGLLVTWTVESPAEAGSAAALLIVAGAAALLLRAHPRLAPALPFLPMLACALAVTAVVLAGWVLRLGLI